MTEARIAGTPGDTSQARHARDTAPSGDSPAASGSSAKSGSSAAGAEPAPRRALDPIIEPAERAGAHAMVPLPGTHRVEPRPSLWKRITMRSGALGETGASRLLARLDVIEARVISAEQSLATRMQRLDERFTEVWEIEEQISQMNDLRETLEEVGARQVHLDARIDGIKRRLTLLSLAIGAAVIAAIAAAVALG